MMEREERLSVLMAARMLNGHDWSDVSIRNVSRHGLMLASLTPPAVGAYVEIRRATRIIIGRIVWVKDCLFGMQTVDAINVVNMLHGDRIVAPAFGPTRAERRVDSRPGDGTAAAKRIVSNVERWAALALAAMAALVSVVSFLR